MWWMEMSAPRRTVLDDLIARDLRQQEFLVVDGAPGLEKANRRRSEWRARSTLHGS